ncbi:hypothetical protein AgCh_036296 [Apium graveolens]
MRLIMTLQSDLKHKRNKKHEEERRARNEAEYEDRKRKYDEEIEMFIKKSEELKAKGMSRIFKDGKILNVKAGKFTKFRIDLLDGYPKPDRLKLVEALSGTPIIQELEILVKKPKKVQVTERAIWNCFKQSDFLPLNWRSSDEEYFQQLAEEIVRVWVVTLREVIIYYEDESFTFLGCNLMDTFSPTEIKRVISLLKDKDTATRAWRSVLAEWLIVREEMRARNKAEYEERKRKYDEEIEMYIKRSEELKAKGMSRISKDGRFLNVKADTFSKFRIDLLSGYPKPDRLKLVEALRGTPIEKPQKYRQVKIEYMKIGDIDKSNYH